MNEHEIDIMAYRNYCKEHQNRDITCEGCRSNSIRNARIEAQQLLLI